MASSLPTYSWGSLRLRSSQRLPALLGIGLTWLFFDGVSASTLGSSFSQVVFSFSIPASDMRNGLILALIIGAVGGLFPAWRAARQKLTSIDRD